MNELYKQLTLLWWRLQTKSDPSAFIREVEPGVKMSLYFDDALSRLIYFDAFEKNERQFLKDFLKPNDVFVDLGANIGIMTVVAAHQVGAKGKVLSFEPTSKTFKRLRANVSLNKFRNVTTLQQAVSDKNGKIAMHISLDGYAAWNSLAKPAGGVQFSTETVPTTTLDSFVQKHHLKTITMVKIDVEGWEMHVLKGAHKTLSKKDAPLLQVEFTDSNLQAASTTAQVLYRALQKFGYRMYAYDASKKQLVRDPLRKVYPYLNLFAIKDLAMAKKRLLK